MPRHWFLSQGEKTYGPYTSSKLKELASTGKIASNALVSDCADGPWHPISHVKELKLSHAPAVPPPLPPTPQRQPAAQRQPVQQPQPSTSPAQVRTAPITATEKHVWSGRPSQITNMKTFILCGLFCWLIVPVFVAVWRWLQVRCLNYELTTQRFKVSHGVLTRRTDELELYRVKDTSFSQDLFQRIFGLASVYMRSSDSSSPSVTIYSIAASEAKKLREEIRTLTEELRDRKRVREFDHA